MKRSSTPFWGHFTLGQLPYPAVTSALAAALCLNAVLRLLLSDQPVDLLAQILTLTRLTVGVGLLVWIALDADRFPRWVGFASVVSIAVVLVGRVAMDPDNGASIAALYEFPYAAFYLVWFYRPVLARVVIYCTVGATLGVAIVPSLLRGDPIPVTHSLLTFVIFTTCATAVSHYMLSHQRRRVERDPVTGVLNRHGVYRAGKFLSHESSASQGRYCVVMIDADKFKEINDTAGHQAGDQALRELADHLVSLTRDIDVIGRIGGDEFVVILPYVTEEAAPALLDRVRSTSPVAFSYGYANRHEHETFEDALGRADEQMYEQKRARAAGRGPSTRDA
ncbi:GGDEF domain-containing protein [Zhihengliuella flava]|uniref:Diguanylate cyclase (GGDEF)-like protein n=1 Tax=Zhihengliuella flava TaxID=1285193 RepID=A0A931DDF3_9MICC|nr:GGDEF domain-containing protein [Zhihengliuella flava]MBG6084750.1 diguanylate cyclase (GGDEF)-like protein [Zhihengliuella flava]